MDTERCVGCGACRMHCPENAIRMLPGWKAKVDPMRCIGCGMCVRICHQHAARLVPERSGIPVGAEPSVSSQHAKTARRF
ncbi:MAG: 4Fe-4S binding protein [Coriobacteriales bacterium]